jgi:hypothetical protein
MRFDEWKEKIWIKIPISQPVFPFLCDDHEAMFL